MESGNKRVWSPRSTIARVGGEINQKGEIG